MKDHRGLGDQSVTGLAIRYITGDKLSARDAGISQIGRDHLGSGRHQPLREMSTDKAAGSRDHQSLFALS